MKTVSWLLLFFLAFALNNVQAEESLKLLARSQIKVPEPGLNAAEWRWVHEHRKIRLAVWLPMSPPFDITTGLNDYGGINADFLGLATKNLGIEIEVIRFQNYDDALVALQTGQADFIAHAGENQRRQGLILSIPYSPNNAVEVVNSSKKNDESIEEIAVSSGYDRQMIQARYPQARIIPFSSALSALEALAFQRIDLYFCDEISARYLVSQSNFSNLHIRQLATPLPVPGFAFATMPQMRAWINILNKLLKSLPENVSDEIHRRWNGGMPHSLIDQQPMYSSLEHKWIDEHPRIRVAVAEDNPPLAFFDESGQLHGIIAEILTALRVRTGFSFEIQRYPTQRAALDAVKNGEDDLVAGVNRGDIWRTGLLTTRTWHDNSWVMVGRANDALEILNPRIITLDGQSPETWLHQQNRGQSVKVQTWHEGLTRILRGESDMIVMPLIVANARLASKEYASLRLLESIDIDPMHFAFGASKQAWPLVTIVNKALINIPPEDLHALTRGGNAGNTFTYVTTKQMPVGLLTIIACTAFLLLVSGIVYFRHRQRRVLQRLLDAIPAPLFVSDAYGVVQAGNQALYDALSITPVQARGKNIREWCHGVTLTTDAETRIMRQSDRVIRLWHYPLAGKKQFIGGWIDETRQRHFIQKLRTAKRRANDASKAKSAFLTTMSHEIRTPVSAILGMLELVMKRAGETPQNQQSVRVAWDAAQSLLLLIGNILDVSRIESGRLILRPERASLRALIEEAVMLFEGLAAKKRLGFVLEIDAELQEDVLVDRSRFRQILVNLAGNAIKYTEQGQVALRAQSEGREGDYILLRIEVEDTGEGIDEATQQRLFHPFVQGNSRNVAQGSGLGLYICRTLAQMMGGSIHLQSEPDKGTRVTVMLKLPILTALSEAPGAQEAQQQHSGTLTILIVDDNAAGRMVLSQQLGWLGHRVVNAENPQQAMEKLKRIQPDVVITDCNMPGMSGFELTKLIRSRYPDLAIFGLTADAREAVREEAREAGMNDCLFKPATLRMLEDLLASVSPAIPTTAAVRWSAQHNLPAPLLEGGNLGLFLSLQISVLDETLDNFARWRETPESISLRETLHKLRGGIQLLGVDELEALCWEQEQMPDAAGIERIEKDIIQLRAALELWRDTGLQPVRKALQQNEDSSASK